MPTKPNELRFNDLNYNTIMQELNEYDKQASKYYLETNKHDLNIFNELMSLFSLLISAIPIDNLGFYPNFTRGDSAQMVLAYSACGAFRNLRVANKLLLEGYFLEMQAVLRTVEQWLEYAVILEGNPAAAQLLIENGLDNRNKDIKKAIVVARQSSQNINQIYSDMQKTFHKLSQRCHPLKTALNLICKKEDNCQLIIGATVSDEMFCQDLLALNNMVINSITILSRHFQKLPEYWQTNFTQVKEKLTTQ